VSDDVAASSEIAIAEGSKSFAAAARLFDKATRDDAVMLYAWCRHCDDVIDGQTLGHGTDANFRAGQMERLEQLKVRTAAAIAGQPTSDPVFEALRRVVARNNVPARYPHELLEGFAMDVAGRRYVTVGDTLDYCYHVAGVVGVMMAMIMGSRAPRVLDRACDLGMAFQLTNIARDIVDDARVGRVYVPEEILARHGLTTIDPDDATARPALHAAALDLLDLADDYYASAYVGLAALPVRSAWAVASARRVYRAIGARLKRRGPDAWNERISTSSLKKVALIGAGLVDVIGSRFADDTPRADLWRRP
jgi:phytoene synthase